MAKKGKFAEGTTVNWMQSRAEIEQTLGRYGASGFAYATMVTAGKATRNRVEFKANQRQVRFEFEIPPYSDKSFVGSRDGWRGPGDSVRIARREQEERRMWRALLLAIKAKLEVVASGMAVFEEEFMANIVMPDGMTVGKHAAPWIESAYASGRVAGLLGAGDQS